MKLFYTLLFLLIILSDAPAQNVLVVPNGATLTTTGGVIITLQDMDLQCDGTIDQQPGDGKFVFNGIAGNQLSGAGLALFDVLEIAKTGGAGIALARSVTIGSSINFTSGSITLTGGNVFLQPSAILNGENETSHITAGPGNYIGITTMLNAPSAANPGNLGAIITSSQNLGSTVIRRGHTPENTGAGYGISRYYTIIPANDNALDATLRLTYFKAELNGVAENSLTLWKSTDSLTWTLKGFTSRDSVNRYVETTGLSDLSYWTLAAATSLAVQFTSFDVRCDSDDAMLTWQTANEQNSNHFDVQFSSDRLNWQTIGTVPAAGNSAQPRNYSFTDNRTSGTGFYRIAEWDDDGQAMYTDIDHSDCHLATGSPATSDLTCWPNPVQGLLTVNLAATASSQLVITVIDNHGATVRQQTTSLFAGNNQLTINMTGLASGIYAIQFQWGGNRRTARILKR